MEYFEPTGLGKQIFEERYAKGPDEDWFGAADRVGSHVAAAEDNGKVAKYAHLFAEEIKFGRFMPGGRIMYGAGRPKAQLLNCFVIPAEDSREGWGKILYDTCVISGLGGGIGVNCSPIRGRGSPIAGTGGYSTGSVSAMKMQNSVSEELRQGGGRRAALMQCLDFNHPDIEEFLEVKLDKGELNNANISVNITMDSKEFQAMVREDKPIELMFNGLPTGKSISAKWLWNKIVQNASASGEPGILNGFLANKMNNIWYYEDLISTNPCGEIWLGAYDCCCLGSLVLPTFVEGGKFNWDQFDASIRLAVRFLDNVLTVNHFPLPEIKNKCHHNRRIGAGTMGGHTMLLKLGMAYHSDEAYEFVDKLMAFYKNTAYDASATLAAEKGPFPGFKPDEFLSSGFAKTLKRGIRNKIRSVGIRNCALLNSPPTGTTSMTMGVSSAWEPLYAPAYWRKVRASDENGRDYFYDELVVTDEYKEFGDIVQGAYDVPLESHLKMQAVVQKHIDNAMSKTINISKDYPVDKLADVLLEFLPDLKGITLYREGSRENEPLRHVPLDEVAGLLLESGETKDAQIDELSFLDCPNGVCDIPALTERREPATV